MTIRTAAAIAVCSFAISQFVVPSLAAPNGHANEHAQANSGGSEDHGGGNSNGNGSGNSNNHADDNGGGSVVRANVVATGAKQGDVASILKSWNSLNANPKAFADNLNNPNSLLGKEAVYVCANSAAKDAEAAFTSLAPSGNPPTADQVASAQSYLDAQGVLGALKPADVLADPSSYSQAEVDAATLISTSTLTIQDAQNTINAQKAWDGFQNTSLTAGTAFATASVSYKGSSDLSALRAKVDEIVALKNLDTTELCASLVASAQ